MCDIFEVIIDKIFILLRVGNLYLLPAE